MRIKPDVIRLWNELCRKQESNRRTKYKILRAIAMGKTTHFYLDGDYVVQYYDIFIYVDQQGNVSNIWKDNNLPQHKIPRNIKHKYDEGTSHMENIKKAIRKHRSVLRRVSETISGKAC